MTSGGTAGSFDPDIGSQPTVDFARWNNVYDQLIFPDNEYSPKPGLAEVCEPNADATKWTIRLRDGVEFHDGRTVTADDLIYSLRRHAQPNSSNAPLFAFTDTKNIRKLDSRTVEVPMQTPFALLDANFQTGPAGMVFPQDFDPRKPIGTGPFRVVSSRPGSETVLERFPNYWGEAALPDQVTISEFDDATARANALFAGQVDAIEALPQSQVRVAQASSNVDALIAPSGAFRPLTMRADTAPLNDVRVRQALRLMVDREQMISAAYAGRADVGNDVYGRWDPTYAGESFPQRQQDIDQAKSLLRQAGQEGLSLELVTAPIAAGVVEASTVFAQQAKAAGVTVNIRKLPAGSYYNAPWPYPFGVDIWGTPLYFFVAASATGPQAASAFNSAHWRNPRWDKLYKEAIGQVDLKKRTELSTEMQRIEHDEGGWIVWGFPNWVDGVSKRIAGVPKGKFQMPLGDLRFASIGLVS